MKNVENLIEYEKNGKGLFEDVDQNVVSKMLSYLDFIDLSRTATVSRFFRRKALEQRGFWVGYFHRDLPTRGFSVESINLFFSLVEDSKVDYPKILERVHLLKRIDFTMANLTSSELSMETLDLNSVYYGHRYLAILSGQMPLLCQISHQCLRIHSKQPKVNALFSVAYLLGMTNMCKEFVQWVKKMEFSDHLIYLPFIQGLAYKKHDAELVQCLAKNTENLKPFGDQLHTHLTMGLTMRSESPSEEVSAEIKKALVCIKGVIEEKTPLSTNTLEICLSYSSNIDNFTQICNQPEFQQKLVTNLRFILGLFASENVPLLRHLIVNKILSPNQLYPFDFTVYSCGGAYEKDDKRLAGGHLITRYILSFANIVGSEFPENQISLFQLACHFGCLDVIRILTEQRCDIKHGNDYLHTTPLKLALLSKQLSVVNFLCEKGILPTEENLLCERRYNPLHFLLMHNIIDIQKHPALMEYIHKLLMTKVTAEMADRFALEDAEIGTPLGLLPTLESIGYLTPVDFAHIYQQTKTLLFLLSSKYITDITPSLLFSNLNAEELHACHYSTRCSFQELQPYLPSKEDHEEAQAMLNAIWEQMGHWRIGSLDKYMHPEEYFYIHTSFLFLLKHYRYVVDAKNVFNLLLDGFLEARRVDESQMADFYEDFLKPLFEFSPTGITHLESGRLIRNKIDLLMLDFQLVNPPEHNCIQYFLPMFFSMSNVTEDLRPIVSVTDIQDLILQAPAEDLAQVDFKDTLKRDTVCVFIDSYLKNPSPENFNILQSIVSKMPSLKTPDSQSQDALTRLFENEEAHPALYNLFYRAYGSNPNQRYYYDFLDHKSLGRDNKRIRLESRPG